MALWCSACGAQPPPPCCLPSWSGWGRGRPLGSFAFLALLLPGGHRELLHSSAAHLSLTCMRRGCRHFVTQPAGLVSLWPCPWRHCCPFWGHTFVPSPHLLSLLVPCGFGADAAEVRALLVSGFGPQPHLSGSRKQGAQLLQCPVEASFHCPGMDMVEEASCVSRTLHRISSHICSLRSRSMS